jgi:hypothetical protein
MRLATLPANWCFVTICTSQTIEDQRRSLMAKVGHDRAFVTGRYTYISI